MLIGNPGLLDLIDRIGGLNSVRCRSFYAQNEPRFRAAWGSSHNHQAYPGGYVEHVSDAMFLAMRLYTALSDVGRLPFTLPDALLVLFLHDLEKPWRQPVGGRFDKTSRKGLRWELIERADLALTPEQVNALDYVEGEGEDYRSDRRVMNELAAFCHMCDVASARIFHGMTDRIT
jgi:hypothetical protein